MNRFLYSACTLLVLGLSGCSQVEPGRGIEFFHGTFEQALEKADDEDKLVFVDVYTTWCGPCKVMAETVFPDHEVGEYFNERFVSFKLDAEDVSIDGPRIANTYDVGAYPTLLFLNPDGTEAGRGVAGYDIDGLLGLARDVLSQQSSNVDLLAELSTRYQEGDRDKNFVQEFLYVSLLVRATSTSEESDYSQVEAINAAFNEYIATHSSDTKSLINRKDFQLISAYAARRPKSHPAVAFVVENYDAFAETVPEFALCYFVVECNYSSVLNLARASDQSYLDHIALLDSELKHAHDMVAAEDPNNAILKHNIEPRARTEYLIASQDWEGYLEEIKTNLDNAADNQKARIMGNAASRLMYSGVDEYVDIGSEYAKLAYEADSTIPINVMSYSSALTLAGDTDTAIEVIEEFSSTLEPSSPHYNFRNWADATVTQLKTMASEESDSKNETNPDIDT